MISELEFKSLAAQGYNRIPLMAEAFADLETPLSLYLKLAFTKDGGKYSFLLESVVGGERFGRYSFIGLPARTLLRATDDVTEVVTDGQVVELPLPSAAERCGDPGPGGADSQSGLAPGLRADGHLRPAQPRGVLQRSLQIGRAHV